MPLTIGLSLALTLVDALAPFFPAPVLSLFPVALSMLTLIPSSLASALVISLKLTVSLLLNNPVGLACPACRLFSLLSILSLVTGIAISDLSQYPVTVTA